MKIFLCLLALAVFLGTMAAAKPAKKNKLILTPLPEASFVVKSSTTEMTLTPTIAAPVPERVPQKTCPVMGGSVGKKYYVDHKGQRIYVCSPKCLKEVKKDPAKYLKKLHSMGEEAEFLKK